MAWLDDLYAKVGAHPGSWGIGSFRLPDFGKTEDLANQIAKIAGGAAPLTEELGSSLFGPTPAYAQDPYSGEVRPTTYTPPQRQPEVKGESTVLSPTGGSSGGSGGDIGGSVPTGPTGPSPDEIARQELQSKLGAINARLQQMRDIAQRNIGTARGVRDEVIGNIGQTYANLVQQAESRRNAALGALGQEDVGVQNLYGRAGGTARRAMESALTRNRMTARAMNRLDSSFYDELQAGATEGGRQAISDLAQEEAGKRAAIGTRKTETEDWFNQQASTIAQEEASLKSQAEREYQNQVNAAADMERAYGIDSLAAAEQAEREFSSKLAQIDAYIQDRGTQLIQLAAATGQNLGNVLNQYQAVNDTLSRALGINQALGRAQALPTTLPTFSGVSTAGQISNYLPWYQQQPQTPEDEVQQRLNQVFGYQ